jgi:hypothetical protein
MRLNELQYFGNKHISGHKAEGRVHAPKRPVHYDQTLLEKHNVLHYNITTLILLQNGIFKAVRISCITATL